MFSKYKAWLVDRLYWIVVLFVVVLLGVMVGSATAATKVQSKQLGSAVRVTLPPAHMAISGTRARQRFVKYLYADCRRLYLYSCQSVILSGCVATGRNIFRMAQYICAGSYHQKHKDQFLLAGPSNLYCNYAAAISPWGRKLRERRTCYVSAPSILKRLVRYASKTSTHSSYGSCGSCNCSFDYCRLNLYCCAGVS